MVDIDNFVSDCTAALGESESRRAIREVLAQTPLIIHLPG
jgi:hypothetical protein